MKAVIIIPTFNEEKAIRSKIENTLKLRYNKEPYKIIVVDDNSTDKTREIVKECVKHNKRIELILNKFEKGKIGALKTALANTKEEIIAMTDADVILDEFAMYFALEKLKDKKIGAVCGIQELLKGEDKKAFDFENVYRKFSTIIRLFETKLDSTPVFYGQFMVVKRKCLPADFADDTDIAIRIRKKGYKTKYIKEIKFYEKTTESLNQLSNQKTRRSIGLLITFWEHKRILFNPKYGLYGLLIYPLDFFLYMIQPTLMILIFLGLLVYFSLKSLNYLLVYIAFISIISFVLKSYIIINLSLLRSFYYVLFKKEKAKRLYKFCNWSNIRNDKKS